MSLFTKIAAACAIGSFAAMLVLAVVGHFLETHGIVRNREAAATVTKLTAFSLFLVLGYSLIPLMIHVFVVAQGGIGNADVGMVRFLREHERGVSLAFWGFFTTGLLLALPVMWTDLFGFNLPLPRGQGVITANVGMTLAEAAARSTFKVAAGSRRPLTGSSMSISEGVFDFEVADAGIRFDKCRYCCLETGSHDDPKIVHINAGVSTRKMPRVRLAVEREEITRRLRAAGWSAGHYEYTDPQLIKLHGGAREGDGRYWVKDHVLLLLSEKRMDDEQPGEDPRSAGEFIHVIDLLPGNDPSYQDLIFDPGRATGAPALETERSK